MRRADWPVDLKPHEYANWRTDKFAKNAGPAPWLTRREQREGNSNAHLALIRQLWCTLGHERWDIDAHHLKTGPAKKERALGRKATDRWAVPLWRVRHDELERLGSRHEFAFFADHGINPYALAAALWAASGDLPRMARVLTAHQLQASADKVVARGDTWERK